MTNHPTPSAGRFVVVHLLDPAQGHSLHTWRFDGQDVITIGRSDDNDVALADPHVSRSHARLVHDSGSWTLISTGRHGTLINDRVVSEARLQQGTVFRLGAAGPMLRFDTSTPQFRRTETIDNFDGEMYAMLEIDEQRKKQEVDHITGSSLFRELREQKRRVKADGQPE